MGNLGLTEVIIFIIVVALIFLALREVNTWYWKLNEVVKNQEKQLDLMRKQLDIISLLSLKSGVPDSKITSALDKNITEELTTRGWIEANKNKSGLGN